MTGPTPEGSGESTQLQLHTPGDQRPWPSVPALQTLTCYSLVVLKQLNPVEPLDYKVFSSASLVLLKVDSW